MKHLQDERLLTDLNQVHEAVVAVLQEVHAELPQEEPNV